MLPRDADAPEELRAPNYATFSLLGKLEAERADLFAKASQKFPIPKPLTSVPKKLNRVQVDLSREILESPELAKFKKFMRNLMQRTYDADTALWRDEDEGKWRESSALAGANGATADAPTDAPTSSNNTNDQTDEAPGPSLLNKVSAAIHCLPSTSSSSSSTGIIIPISPAPVRGLKRIPAPASSPLELYKRPRKMEP
ncbi:unnamed protein product, partial [Mesorhabditis spiculigera]